MFGKEGGRPDEGVESRYQGLQGPVHLSSVILLSFS